jgi:hypothetical protein
MMQKYSVVCEGTRGSVNTRDINGLHGDAALVGTINLFTKVNPSMWPQLSSPLERLFVFSGLYRCAPGAYGMRARTYW